MAFLMGSGYVPSAEQAKKWEMRRALLPAPPAALPAAAGEAHGPPSPGWSYTKPKSTSFSSPELLFP